MKKEDMKSKVDVFVCNHYRDDKHKDDCYSKGAKELTDNLKKWAKDTHGKEIRIFRGGCIGKCSEGIAIACYPAKKFFLEATPKDEEDIKKGLEKALSKVD